MNKYKKWYNQLMVRAKKRKLTGYFEKHHIKPRALGGSNAKRNIVKLTYREHFLAHWLLVKFTKGASKRKMQSALLQMCRVGRGKQRIASSWQFEIAKKAVKAAMTGRKHSIETRKAISVARTGSSMPAEFKLNMSKRLIGNKIMLGKKLSKEHREKISIGQKGRKAWNKGICHSKEHKEKISKSLIGNKRTKGRKLSPEHIAALRAGHKRYFEGCNVQP